MDEKTVQLTCKVLFRVKGKHLAQAIRRVQDALSHASTDHTRVQVPSWLDFDLLHYTVYDSDGNVIYPVSGAGHLMQVGVHQVEP